MRTTVISLISILFLKSILAQSGVEIRLKGTTSGTGPNLAGTTYEVDLTPFSPQLYDGLFKEYFMVKNISNEDKQWQITRVKLNVPSDWPTDYLCWPPLCYPASSASYTTPNTANHPAPITSVGSETELELKLYPNTASNSSATYRYYINEGGTYIDSFDLTINYSTTSVKDISKEPLVFYPNPTANKLHVELKGEPITEIQIINLDGSIVKQSNEIQLNSSTKTIFELKDLPNGIYFLKVIYENKTSLSEKFVKLAN
jgi:hypothetical protein